MKIQGFSWLGRMTTSILDSLQSKRIRFIESIMSVFGNNVASKIIKKEEDKTKEKGNIEDENEIGSQRR